MKFTHLNDLWDFAYGIPVVLWCLDNVDKDEYKKHFIPVMEGTAYWSSLIACYVIATGTPWTIICGPLATVCENGMTMFISPALSPIAWKQICKQ